MLSIENYELIDRNPKFTPCKKYWVFRHKNNPNRVECVFKYTTDIKFSGEVTGHPYLIRELKDLGIDLIEPYVPTKQFLKEYERMVKLNQTGMVVGFKGYSKNND